MNKEEAVVITESVDTEKRGRIILLSMLITLSMFVVKIAQTWDANSGVMIYLTAFIYFLVSFFGLVWAFSFKVRWKSIPCLAQSSLFVASEFLFVEMFFFEDFDRLYEAFLLLGMLALIWIATYVSFLMSNIFNVGLYKDIPLEQVGRTASYLISIFMVYFFTFSLLANGMSAYILIPAVLIGYISIVAMHIRNLELERKDFIRRTALSVLIMLILFLGSFLTGSKHEFISIIPTVGFFAAIGGLSGNASEGGLKRKLWLYAFLLFVVVAISIWNNL